MLTSRLQFFIETARVRDLAFVQISFEQSGVKDGAKTKPLEIDHEAEEMLEMSSGVLISWSKRAHKFLIRNFALTTVEVHSLFV